MQDSVFNLHEELERDHWWFRGRRDIIAKVIDKVLHDDSNAAIIDIGCGTGGNLASIANKYQCSGLDVSPMAIQYAKRRYPNIDFRIGNIYTDLTSLNQNVRLYMLLDVLEHVDNDQGFLQAVVQAASSGTNILITVPADPNLWSKHDEVAGHYRRYTLDSLEKICVNCPVRIRLLSSFNVRLYPIIAAVRMLNRYLDRASGQGHTDFFMPPAPLNWLLTKVFGGEARSILAKIDKPSFAKSGMGVSLVALLERI
jgi:SAM-dependent methyltransferase